MGPDENASPLDRILGAVADGGTLDWETARRDGGPQVAPFLKQLRDVAEIAAFNRSLQDRTPSGSEQPIADQPRSWGHLVLLERLGRGAFAEVYRAWDPVLEREIALKLIAADTGTGSADAALDEGRALARVRHPNVVVLHGVDRHDGRVGLWMDLIRGPTLEQYVADRGPCSIEDSLRLAADIGSALAAVHEAGLVHRDVKPANIVRDANGRFLLADFGLGFHASTPRHDFGLSGTPMYMAPELFSGGRATAGSDLYALGAVLWFALAGRAPFEAETLRDLITAIQQDPKPPLRDLRPDLPPGLAELVVEAMTRKPEQRIASARRLTAALDAISASVPGAGSRHASRMALVLTTVVAAVLAVYAVIGHGRRSDSPVAPAVPVAPAGSIAVLPFIDMSPSGSQEFFCEGISEALLNLLARTPGLLVTSRSSSFSFKRKDASIPDIARSLNVECVLEGSVRRSGDVIRIGVQLVDGQSDKNRWAQTYERKFADIFSIQDDIAADVARELRPALLDTPKARPTDPAAYVMYLQAVQLSRQFTREGWAQSDALLREVLKVDPHYAPAWADLANNDIQRGNLGFIPFAEGVARARVALAKSFQNDSTYAPTYVRLGLIDLHERNITGAARRFERALQLDPSNVVVLLNGALLLQSLGRTEAALTLGKEICRRDPMSASPFYNLALEQIDAGQFAEAVVSARAALARSAGPGMRFAIGESYLLQDSTSTALEEFGAEPDEFWRLLGQSMAWHALGRSAASESSLTKVIDKYAGDAAYNIAQVYAFRGQADQAFAWLDRALEQNDTGFTLIVADRLFANIRPDSRWEPFLRRIGKAPEQLAGIPFFIPFPN